MIKYLGGKDHDIFNLAYSGSRKKYSMHGERETEKERESEHA